MKKASTFKCFLIFKSGDNDEAIFVKLPIEYDENKEYDCYLINHKKKTCTKTKMKFPYDKYLTCQTIYDNPSKDGYIAYPISPSKWMDTLKYWKYTHEYIEK